MELKIAICDDVPIFCETAKEKINKLRPKYSVDLFYSGSELMASSTSYDIIFLDIDMPAEDGMVIAQKLRAQDFIGYIVFMTCHEEFIYDAFKVKAFRYLLKPLNIDYIEETLSNIEKELMEVKKVVIGNIGRDIIIDIRDIIYIKSNNKNTVIYTNGQTIDSFESLKYWKEELDNYNFYQVHKSYIISMGYVREISSNKVILDDENIKIPVSRRRLSDFKNKYNKYMREHARFM